MDPFVNTPFVVVLCSGILPERLIAALDEGTPESFGACYCHGLDTPELIWTKSLRETLRKHVLDYVRTGPGVGKTGPFVQIPRLIYEELENEFVIDGIYMRCFIKESAWPATFSLNQERRTRFLESATRSLSVYVVPVPAGAFFGGASVTSHCLLVFLSSQHADASRHQTALRAVEIAVSHFVSANDPFTFPHFSALLEVLQEDTLKRVGTTLCGVDVV